MPIEKVKLKREQILKLFNACNSITGNYETRFSYAIARNLSKLSDVSKDISKIITPPKDIMEYISAKNEGMAGSEEMNKKMEDFEKQSKEFLKEEEEVEIFKVSVKVFPSKGEVKNIFSFFPIIKEPEDVADAYFEGGEDE